MRFSNIPGYTLQKTQLLGQLPRIPHAQMLWGCEVALPLALSWIAYLHCTNRQENDSCGSCPACRQILTNPDTQFIIPVGQATNTNQLNDWRKLITNDPYMSLSDWCTYLKTKHLQIGRHEVSKIIQNISIKTFSSPYKVVLIWGSEYLHTSAANAMLKILEEPPPQTHFILVSSQISRVLPTILSRLQKKYIPPFTDEAMRQILFSDKTDDHKIEEAIRLSDGDLARAKYHITKVNDTELEKFSNWMRWCYASKWENLITQSFAFQELHNPCQQLFLKYALHMLRELLTFDAEKLSCASQSEKTFLQKFSKVTSTLQIKQMTGAINSAYSQLERNANPKLLYISLSIQITQILNPAALP